MVNAKYDSTDGILGNHVFFVFYEFQNIRPVKVGKVTCKSNDRNKIFWIVNALFKLLPN